MNEKLVRVLQWVLDVNCDIYELESDEVIPGVTLKDMNEMINELKK